MIANLRQLIAAPTFVPFTICTASGARLRVPSVDHIAVAPTGVRVVVFDDDGSAILVSALLIGHIEVDPEPAQSAGV